MKATSAYRSARMLLVAPLAMTMTACDGGGGDDGGERFDDDDSGGAFAGQCEQMLATETLPSQRLLEMHRQDGYVMHLQRGVVDGQPTVRVWEWSTFVGEEFLPITVQGVNIAVLTVTEPRVSVSGLVEMMQVQKPVARFCADRWSARRI